MAAQANLKSIAITNFDATPPVRPTAGAEGGHSYLYDVVGIAGPTTSGATTGGVLQMVRIPSNAVIRALYYCQKAATTTATFDIGLYYSDGSDGTSVSNKGLVLIDDFFGSAIDTHAATTWVDTTFANAAGYLPTDTVLPIWNAANSALTENPGGFFDITFLNTATISGAATMLCRVQYVIAAP